MLQKTKKHMFFLLVIMYSLLISSTSALPFSTNLLNCNSSSSSSDNTYIQNVDDYSSAFRSNIIFVTTTTSNTTRLYYIVSEQKESEETATFSLAVFDTVTKTRLVIDKVDSKNTRMNTISNIVTSGKSSVQFQLVQFQSGFNESEISIDAKLAIVTYNNDKMVNHL